MCGDKFLRQWLWHCLAKLCTKNYENPSIFVKVTAKNQWHLFFWTRCRRHSVERTYLLRQRCSHDSRWIKPRLAATTGRANTHMWDFPDVIKFRVAAYTVLEKAIRFQHPDYNPDLSQKLISSFMSRHLLTRNISSKCMHAFLINFYANNLGILLWSCARKIMKIRQYL